MMYTVGRNLTIENCISQILQQDINCISKFKISKTANCTRVLTARVECAISACSFIPPCMPIYSNAINYHHALPPQLLTLHRYSPLTKGQRSKR